MSKINILVVDDSSFMRKVITDILESDAQLKVVGTAKNGQDALEKLPKLHPDVITLDVEMPILMDHYLRKDSRELFYSYYHVKQYDIKVVHGDTVSALEKGAFDFVTKPSPHLLRYS